MAGLDSFFNLGNRATGGDPQRKAQFDYYLYFIVFLAFLFIGLNYFYNYFFNHAATTTLVWGIVMIIIDWFNYWALSAFRGVYIQLKSVNQRIKDNKPQEENTENIKEMLDGFKRD